MNDVEVSSLSSGGRVVIPAAFRRALGLKDGDQVLLELHDGEIHLTTRARRLARARERVARLVPGGASMAEELLRDRRAEADGEDGPK